MKLRFLSQYASMAIEIQLVDLELGLGKSKYTPGSIEIAWRGGALPFSKIWTCLYLKGC